MNIKPYCSGNKIRSIENPIIGKPLSKIASQIEELAINFSVIKLNRVIGKIRVINAVIRLSNKENDNDWVGLENIGFYVSMIIMIVVGFWVGSILT